MSDPICNSDSGRFLKLMCEIEHEGNEEYDREHAIVPHGDKFCVGGVVIVATRKEAEALLSDAA